MKICAAWKTDSWLWFRIFLTDMIIYQVRGSQFVFCVFDAYDLFNRALCYDKSICSDRFVLILTVLFTLLFYNEDCPKRTCIESYYNIKNIVARLKSNYQ